MQLITQKIKQTVETRSKSGSSNSRSSKALALSQDVIRSGTTSTFFVPSETVSGKLYEVRLSGENNNRHVCDCPDFEYRCQMMDGTCKHVDAVRIFLSRKEEGKQ